MSGNKIKALIFGFAFTVFHSFTNFSINSHSITQKVLRIHIIPNSDAPEDQILKIKIKDRILSEHKENLSNLKNLIQAKNYISQNINNINKTIKEEIINNNLNYSFKTEFINNMYFGTRYYENTVFPAGDYQALRITLGNGTGKNWWCVLFPSICLSSASEQTKTKEVFIPAEQEIITSPKKYKIKFKILEILT